MLPLDLLRVSLAWAVDSGVEMTRVGAPIIRIISCEPKGFQQSFQLQKYHIPPSLVVDRGVSYVGGCSALDFPFIHDTWPHDLPQNKPSNINELKIYH